MNDVSKVVILRCTDYSEEKVYDTLRNGIGLLGGIERFVNRKENILVKPNFLHSSDQSKAVTTHPSVIKAMLRLLNDAGYGKVKFGDSPAMGSCRSAAAALGLEDGIYGATVADMSEAVDFPFPEGTTAKHFRFAREVTEADAIINLCKMKTHALERITGAVKNVYGLVCGANKAAGHVSFPNASVFARMLTDIHRAVNPRLHIMDGIIAMEGNGPSSGDPVEMNVMLFSDDPVALDTVYCWLIGLDPLLVPTNEQGQVCGIGGSSVQRRSFRQIRKCRLQRSPKRLPKIVSWSFLQDRNKTFPPCNRQNKMYPLRCLCRTLSCYRRRCSF